MEDIIRTDMAATAIMAMRNTDTRTMRPRTVAIMLTIMPSRIITPSTIHIIRGITPHGIITTRIIIMVGATITVGITTTAGDGAGVDGIGTAAEWSARVTSITVTSAPMSTL